MTEAAIASADGAAELIHIGQAVLNLKGSIDYFIQNTFNDPTLAEACKIAGLDAWNLRQLLGSFCQIWSQWHAIRWAKDSLASFCQKSREACSIILSPVD